MRVAQVGVEPTASLVLSQGGLPVAYRADVVSRQYPEQGSNLQSLGFRPSRSTDGVPGRVVSIKVVPDGIEPSFPGCEPSVVAVGPRDCVAKVDPPGIAPGSPACDTGIFLLDDEPILLSGSRGTRTHKRFHTPAVFKTVSSSGRMTSVYKLRELESKLHPQACITIKFRTKAA